jgi:adenylate cyclase, class 1
MLHHLLLRNKQQFTAYNEFRKTLFSELAPKEAEAVLYLLPWLLCVNEPQCPGYIPALRSGFRLYDIDYNKKIRAYESSFKERFGIKKRETLLRPKTRYQMIQGLYTIGSVGSVGQSFSSDCDIWVCIDKTAFDHNAWIQLKQKINLIKDWMDSNLKMPIYFFISDIHAIRQCRFGSVDQESSGSTQQNVLKEEFYRSCMVICGKTPLWWLSFDPDGAHSYNDIRGAIKGDGFWEYDTVDLGNIEQIDPKEYFGAALWQFHKSLSRPLKSIIKIVLLKTLSNASPEKLLCNQFREQVLMRSPSEMFPDFTIFTLQSIIDHHCQADTQLMNFLMECFYMHCEINLYDQRQSSKNALVRKFIERYPIERKRQNHLRKAKSWNYREQIDLGNRIFQFLLKSYKEISDAAEGVASESDQRDLTILGRKISAHYVKKPYKISVIHKPMGVLNIRNLTLLLKENHWQVFSENDSGVPLVNESSLVRVIAFVVWNDLFVPNMVHMRPNPSNVTLNEIITLGKNMKSFFGTASTCDVAMPNYLKKEFVTRIMIVLDFETTPWYQNRQEYCVVYANCWGELSTRAFQSNTAMEKFLSQIKKSRQDAETRYFIRRNTASFEKVIEKAKSSLTIIQSKQSL